MLVMNTGKRFCQESSVYAIATLNAHLSIDSDEKIYAFEYADIFLEKTDPASLSLKMS